MVYKIGERIIRFRKESHLSQEELGANLNVSRQAISKWETGESVPDVYNIIALARLFHITIDELLLGNKPSNTSVSYHADVREKRKSYLFKGRVFLFCASLVFVPPLIIMDASGVTNPTFGIVAGCLILTMVVFMFFAVHNYIRGYHAKEEMEYLERLERETREDNLKNS
ncbi:helix-turn-helix transcriptional regulator [Mycoplasmatota bacterium WC30]